MLRTIDDSPQRQVVECIVEVLPGVGIAVLAVDLVEEAVHGGDIAALVVASQQRQLVAVLYLKTEQQGDGLDGVVTAVHEIADHDVLVVR